MRLFITGDTKETTKLFNSLQKDIDKELKSFTNDVSTVGSQALKGHLPGNRLARRVDKSLLDITPNGYRREVGIKPNDQKDSMLPLWLHYGTGLWGTFGRPISPREHPYMIFFWKGRWIKTKKVLGQKRNFYWDKTVRDTNEFATIRARTLFNNLIER